MVGARRAVTSMVGAAVPDGLEMRAAAENRGQPRANFCNKKYLNKFQCFNCIQYRTRTVP